MNEFPIITILDNAFNTLDYIDGYKSLGWNSQFNDVGTFVMECPITHEKIQRYLVTKEPQTTYFELDNEIMRVEHVTIKSSLTDGYIVTLEGSSLETILKDRITWYDTQIVTYGEDDTDSYGDYGPDFNTVITRLINRNFINATDSVRNIPGFHIAPIPSAIASLGMSGFDFSMLTCFDIIKEICDTFGIRFGLRLDSNKTLELYFKYPVQPDNATVEFSTSFGNVLNSAFQYDLTPKNMIRVWAPDGEYSTNGGSSVSGLRPRSSYGTTNGGLNRREMVYEDDGSANVTTNNISYENRSYAQACRATRKTAKLVLEEQRRIHNFEADIDWTQFKYGKDYDIGDWVYVENEFGMGGYAQVTGFVRTWDDSGINEYPNFEFSASDSTFQYGN